MTYMLIIMYVKHVYLLWLYMKHISCFKRGKTFLVIMPLKISCFQ